MSLSAFQVKFQDWKNGIPPRACRPPETNPTNKISKCKTKCTRQNAWVQLKYCRQQCQEPVDIQLYQEPWSSTNIRNMFLGEQIYELILFDQIGEIPTYIAVLNEPKGNPETSKYADASTSLWWRSLLLRWWWQRLHIPSHSLIFLVAHIPSHPLPFLIFPCIPPHSLRSIIFLDTPLLYIS